MELSKIQEFFKKDRFATDMGIRIEEAKPGYAVCTLTPDERHQNAGGAVQGGAIFTLADFAFAIATNGEGEITVSLENNISFIAVSTGKLTAVATVRGETKRMAFCDVTVTDETGVLVATMSVTGYKKGAKLPIA